MINYLDGWGYQDNLLPEYMSRAGHDVVVVASANHFPSFLSKEEKKRILAKGTNYYVNKVHVYRIKTKLSTSNYNFYCSGLLEILKKENPDVIFHHGLNCSSMMISWKYICDHKNVKFFIDNHSDRINESKCKIWNVIIKKIILTPCTKLINSKVTRYYGVTPGRCDYLLDSYSVDPNKVTLLPIGSDTDTIDKLNSSTSLLRDKYNIPNNSFVIVSGGKMGKDKGTVSLINAFKVFSKGRNNYRLILFGNYNDTETENLAKNTSNVLIFGWCDRKKSLELLKLSNIACWPIHHTTLIEDAVGCSLPLIVRKTSNTSHIIRGNGEFVRNGSVEELIAAFNKITANFKDYKKVAIEMHEKFSYTNIVKQIERDCL